MHSSFQHSKFIDILHTAKEELLTSGVIHPRLMPPSVVAEARAIKSSASTPSLRAKDGTIPPHAKMDNGGNVRVVVRVRAFLLREINKNIECLVKMSPTSEQTTLMVPRPGHGGASSRKVTEEKNFTFDNSFWSHAPQDPHYATQEHVYNSLGEDFLDHNFEGYHTCIFAYGQTGSGKSYTMMGTPDAPGLIPRTCQDLFERIDSAQREDPNISYNVRVSYFEVYNEHVRDLLVPVAPQQGVHYLKIRESPTEGPYVKDLTEVPVRSINEILRHMRGGDNNRTVASTKMNDTSSRSHAVFTIMLKQIHHDMATDETTERSSRIRLVDLAGSERAKSTEATGARLREGSNINKSLTTLGRVIAALADPKHQNPRRPGARRDVVPYRDSVLTWLLKDSLGGNSRTAMIACIAPSDYDETLSTLRYADQAKKIRTRAVVNQDSMSSAERDAQIASMAEEIRRLQVSVSEGASIRERSVREQEERLEEYQRQVVNITRAMEEKSMVAESKIKSLGTENEALRLHLKLALESLKNPIPDVVPLEEEPGEEEEEEDRETEKRRKRKSRSRDLDADDSDQDISPTSSFPSDDEDDTDDGYGSMDSASGNETPLDDKAADLDDYMAELLRDVGLFRRKIGDDMQRFVPEEGSEVPVGVRVIG